MTTLNVPIQLRRGNEVDCPTHMLAGEVYVCLDSGKIFAGTGASTPLKQLGGSAALWGGITGTLSNQTDLQAVLTVLAAADTAEASTRASADTTNATAITTEATTRASADSTEATARAAADSTNATAISTETSRATTAEGLLVPKTTTINGHALSSNVVVSASDLTTGTLPHGQLPAIAEADVTNLVSDLAAKVPTTRTVAGHALSGDVTLAEADITNLTTDLAAKAPLASPALTGTPTAPTAAAATNTTQVATTAFVESEIPLRSAVLSVAGKTGTVTLVESDVASLVSDLALLAPLASPALTGTPTAPTNGTATDNTTQVATDAFVQSALATLGGVVNTNISSATFLGLTGAAATDVTLIASPGAGKAILVESVYLELKFNSIAYTTGTGNLIVQYNQGGAHSGSLAAPILTTTQLKGGVTVGTYQTPAAQAPVVNASLVINLSTAVQYLAGNSTFNVSVRYRIVSA